jgi:peptidoglycan/LPS O-acetylase OafA/YrhL
MIAPSKPAPHSSYRPDIDGLRALSVLAVLAFHADISGFTGGYVGVDVFFVISGYLITRHLTQELETTGRISIAEFYGRRFRRLFPALFFTGFCVLITWSIFFLGIIEDTHRLVKSLRFSLFGLANLYFKSHSGGYFDGQATEMPLLHYWSLAVEEQFYLFWPWLLLLLFRGFRTAGIIAGLVTVSLASFLTSVHFINSGSQQSAFYDVWPRSWELAIGGLISFVSTRSWNPPFWILQGLSFLGLLLVFFAIFSFGPQTPFPGGSAAVPVIGASLLLLAGAHPGTFATLLLSRKLLVWVGTLSYSLYLWHWPLLSLARISNLGATPPLTTRIGLLILSFLIAVFSLRWIETPIRSRKVFSDWSASRIIGASLGSALGLVLFAIGVMEFESAFSGSRFASYRTMVSERTTLYADCADNPTQSFTEKCIHLPKTKGKPIVAMWGDSHGLALFPLVEQYAHETGAGMALFQKSGYPGLDFSILKSKNERELTDVNSFSKAALDTLSKLTRSHPVAVILASRWIQRTSVRPISVADEVRYLFDLKTQAEILSALEASLRHTLNEILKRSVSKVMVVLPYPEFRYSSFRCYRHKGEICDTSRKEMEEYRASILKVLTRVCSEFENVRLVDPVPALCDESWCPQTLNLAGQDVPVTFDDDHPSAAASRHLGNLIRADLDWLSSP